MFGHVQWLGSRGNFFDKEDVQGGNHLNSSGEGMIPIAVSLFQFESRNVIRVLWWKWTQGSLSKGGAWERSWGLTE